MKLLLVAATPSEVQPTIKYLHEHFEVASPYHFNKGNLEITLLITGVGMAISSFAITFTCYSTKYDLLIQAGVAGAIDKQFQLGDVVEVVSDCMADLGVEEKDGSFTSMFELGLLPENEFPFRNGRLWNQPEVERAFLPKVHGITVNKVHGSKASIKKMKKDFPFAQVESMEGAAFFFVGLQMHGHVLQIRAISNYVEPRNKDAWKLNEAIANLNEVLIEVINNLVA